METKVRKLVVTGGPCAGKTTGMSKAIDRLSNLDYQVYVVPEAATILFTNGVMPCENLSVIDFQHSILELQLSNEKVFQNIANRSTSKKVIILHDRGAMDNKAYFASEEEFLGLLNVMSLDETMLRGRYDAVFHLKTAADGAEQFYTLENNAARTESPELARELDEKVIAAWTGHQHLRIIDNSTDFTTKISRVLGEIFSFLGEPVPREIERKFLIKLPDLDVMIKKYNAKKVNILQTYLFSDDLSVERRIRQRGEKGSYIFFYTTKEKVSFGERIEKESLITQDEYVDLLADADTSRNSIRKDRYCFVFENIYFELDVYPLTASEAILEVEVSDINQHFNIPPEIEVIAEVTDQKEYSNYYLSKNMIIQ